MRRVVVRFTWPFRVSRVLLLFATATATTPARAQLHGDASAQAGVMRRVLASKPAGGGDASFGPVAELHAHVAVLPLVRAGFYLAHDAAPMPGAEPALQITSFGARIKVASPVPLDPWRVWAFAGFGYAGVYGPSYRISYRLDSGASSGIAASGAGGGFFEVPAGFGASYRAWRFWHLTAELGARFGFGFSGSVFDLDAGRPAVGDDQSRQFLTNPGRPSAAVGMTVGVMLDL